MHILQKLLLLRKSETLPLKILRFLGWVLFFTPLLFLFLLSFYAVIQGDDFKYILNGEELGVWGTLENQFMHWTGRFTSVFVLSLLIGSREVGLNPMTPVIVSFVMIALSVVTWIVLVKYWIGNLKENIFILGLIFFMFHTQIPAVVDQYFWIVSGVMYTIPLLLMMVSITLFFVIRQRLSYWTLILLVITSMYLCGANEYIALIYLTLIGSSLAYDIFFKYKSTLFPRLLVLGLSIVSFLISALAPGNGERIEESEFLANTSLIQNMVNAAKTIFTYEYKWVFDGHLYLVVLLLIAFFLLERKYSLLGKGYSRRGLVITSLLLFLSVPVGFIYCEIIMGTRPSEWILNILYAQNILFFIVVSAYVADMLQHLSISNRHVSWFLCLSAVFLLAGIKNTDYRVSSLGLMIKDTFDPNLKKFKETWYHRFDELSQENPADTVWVEPLNFYPRSVLEKRHELASPSRFNIENKYFVNGYYKAMFNKNLILLKEE